MASKRTGLKYVILSFVLAFVIVAIVLLGTCSTNKDPLFKLTIKIWEYWTSNGMIFVSVIQSVAAILFSIARSDNNLNEFDSAFESLKSVYKVAIIPACTGMLLDYVGVLEKCLLSSHLCWTVFSLFLGLFFFFYFFMSVYDLLEVYVDLKKTDNQKKTEKPIRKDQKEGQ